jgi:hypothetical protein
MIDLKNLDQVKGLQSNMRTVFESPSGKEVISFLEHICGWYDFKETDRDAIMMGHGKRQVLATIKTLLKHSAEQIQAIANLKE